MSWYYAESGKQNGPVSDADWSALLAAGTIKPDTLVWREGMDKWAAFSTIDAAAPVSAGVVTTAAAESVRCSECGNFFPADEVVMIDGQPVCADCKPVAMQKLKEGVKLTGEVVYGGFWIRFGAKFIDGIILQIAIRSLGLVLGLGLNAAGSHNTSLAAILGVIVGTIVGAAYSIGFNGKYGATPGKMACKLRIVRADGSPLTYGRACGRYFAEILSSLTLMIGFIMAAFDEEKRTLHDRICDTRVIRA